MSALLEKINRKLDWLAYKRVVFDSESCGVTNIYDYNHVCSHRPSAYIEACPVLSMRGIGYALRKYSGYSGKIYCSSEHAISPLLTRNVTEYRDVTAPIFLAPSKERRELLSHHTDKLIVPFGPSYMSYINGIYDEFSIKQIKATNGKTLVVFPQHNNPDSAYGSFMETTLAEIELIKNIAKEHEFETVIACLFYVDIERGLAKLYEDAGFRVVTAGHSNNYDFGMCLKTIHQMADVVITHGISGVAYSVCLGVPCLYLKAMEDLVMKDGTPRPETEWEAPIKRELEQLFGEYTEEISSEQYEYVNRRWGLDQKLSSEQMRLIFEFAVEIKNCYTNDSKVLKKINKKKYEPIKDVIVEAVQIREDNYHA